MNNKKMKYKQIIVYFIINELCLNYLAVDRLLFTFFVKQFLFCYNKCINNLYIQTHPCVRGHVLVYDLFHACPGDQ